MLYQENITPELLKQGGRGDLLDFFFFLILPLKAIRFFSIFLIVLIQTNVLANLLSAGRT